MSWLIQILSKTKPFTISFLHRDCTIRCNGSKIKYVVIQKQQKLLLQIKKVKKKAIQKHSNAIKAIRVYDLIIYLDMKIPDRRQKCESNRIENKQKIITNIIA